MNSDEYPLPPIAVRHGFPCMDPQTSISAGELENIADSLWDFNGSVVGKTFDGENIGIKKDIIMKYAEKCIAFHSNPRYKKLLERGREYFDYRIKKDQAINKYRFINEFQLKSSDEIDNVAFKELMDAVIAYFVHETNVYRNQGMVGGYVLLYVGSCFNRMTLENTADFEITEKLAEWDILNGANPTMLLSTVFTCGGAGLTIVRTGYLM